MNKYIYFFIKMLYNIFIKEVIFMDMETLETFIDNIKNFIIGSIVFISAYLVLNYIIYFIEKYVN